MSSFSTFRKHNRTSSLTLAIALVFALVALSGCYNDDDSPSAGTISGRLIIPPNYALEAEPNDSLEEAQDITQVSRVAGEADDDDPGFALPGVSAEAVDLYRLNITVPVRVTLTIGANELFVFDPTSKTISEVINDLDLAVLDDQGDLIAFSEGLIATETVDIFDAGEYFIGVRAAVGSSPYVVAVTPLQFALSTGRSSVVAAAVLPEEFIPGEILIKAKNGRLATSQQRAARAQYHGATFVKMLPPDVQVLRVPTPPREAMTQLRSGPENQGKLDSGAAEEHLLRASTAEMIKRLQDDPDVVWAQPNYIRRAQIVPNDDNYPLQWHYEQINLPDAWDTTTGSNDIIVAVLDTGILSGHPDLAGRLIAGYDFVSDEFRAQDGDGIDADPEDPGDDPSGHSSSFHGTHVAGTVGATTNNDIGVAGVTWQTRIMPVRVLGALGGTSSEVAQGIRYAAGLVNDSGTVPSEPANVINMSLGGAGTSPIEQEAVTAARAVGTIVVAAAGNDGSSSMYSPAGLDGVISVAAVGATGQKTGYSNYGDKVDVAAPGGEFWDADGDDNLDMVLSTLGNDDGDFIYRYYQGTSMASPHIAGVMALMLDVNPALTPDDIDMLLAGTHPDTSTRITRDSGPSGRDDYYGHGIIDAAAAVIAASEVTGGGGTSPAPNGSRLSVFPTSLAFSNYLASLPLEVSNSGTGTLNITSVTTNAAWLAAAPTLGEAPLVIEVSVDRNGLADGSYAGAVQIETDASEGSSSATVNITMIVGGLSSGNMGQTIVQVLNSDGSQIVAEAVTDSSQGYIFTTPAVPPGTYIIAAGTDRDGDTIICDIEDGCGVSQTLITVNSDGDNVAGVTILVTGGVGQQAPPIEN